MRIRPPSFDMLMMLAALLIAGFIFAGTAHADESWKVKPMIEYQHTSDIFSGCPLRCDKPESSPEFDKFSVGGTFTSPSERFEIDLTLGKKAFDCSLRNTCPTFPEATVRVRLYF